MVALRCPLCGYAGDDFTQTGVRKLACPRCGELFGGDDEPKKIDVAGRTLTVGTAVAATGGLTLLGAVLWLAATAFLTPKPQALPGQDADAARGYMVGYYLGQYLPVAFWAALGTLQAAGGIQLARRRTWPIAVVGAILALAPCGPSFVVGLPIGIWALVVLFQPPVRGAFR